MGPVSRVPTLRRHAWQTRIALEEIGKTGNAGCGTRKYGVCRADGWDVDLVRSGEHSLWPVDGEKQVGPYCHDRHSELPLNSGYAALKSGYKFLGTQ